MLLPALFLPYVAAIQRACDDGSFCPGLEQCRSGKCECPYNGMSFDGYFSLQDQSNYENTDANSSWSTIHPCETWPKDVYPDGVLAFRLQGLILHSCVALAAIVASLLLCHRKRFTLNLQTCAVVLMGSHGSLYTAHYALDPFAPSRTKLDSALLSYLPAPIVISLYNIVLMFFVQLTSTQRPRTNLYCIFFITTSLLVSLLLVLVTTSMTDLYYYGFWFVYLVSSLVYSSCKAYRINFKLLRDPYFLSPPNSPPLLSHDDGGLSTIDHRINETHALINGSVNNNNGAHITRGIRPFAVAAARSSPQSPSSSWHLQWRSFVLDLRRRVLAFMLGSIGFTIGWIMILAIGLATRDGSFYHQFIIFVLFRFLEVGWCALNLFTFWPFHTSTRVTPAVIGLAMARSQPPVTSPNIKGDSQVKLVSASSHSSLEHKLVTSSTGSGGSGGSSGPRPVVVNQPNNASGDPVSPRLISVSVMCHGQTRILDVSLNMSVHQFRELVGANLREPPSTITLRYGYDKPMKCGYPLSHYIINPNQPKHRVAVTFDAPSRCCDLAPPLPPPPVHDLMSSPTRIDHLTSSSAKPPVWVTRQDSIDSLVEAASSSAIGVTITPITEVKRTTVVITKPVTVKFGRHDQHVYDVDPSMTVHDFRVMLAKQRDVDVNTITLRYGRTELTCSRPLSDCLLGESTINASIGTPRDCCARTASPPPTPSSSHETKAFPLEASIERPKPEVITRIDLNGIAYPVNDTKHSSNNEWCLSDDVPARDYRYSNNNRTISYIGPTTVRLLGRTVRSVYGYASHRHQIAFDLSQAASFIGLVAPSGRGFHLKQTGVLVAVKATGATPIASTSPIGLLPRFVDGVKRIRFVLDFTRQLVDIWYDDIMKGSWSFTQLSLPTDEVIHGVACHHDYHGSITLDARLDGFINRFPNSEWPNALADYVIQSPASKQSRRSNGISTSLYHARLKTEVKQPSLARNEFVLMVMEYDNHPSSTRQGIIAKRLELATLGRLPHHPNIIDIKHYFTADWVNRTTASPALFIVLEPLALSLQDIINHRRQIGCFPLFHVEEILMVARDISSALCLFNKELIAHRDIKPENILIRLPSDGSITRDQALAKLRPGVSAVLAGFGSCFDFKANDYNSMSKVLSITENHSAAYTWIPEIITTPPKKELDFTNMDVWSLGFILATMMNALPPQPSSPRLIKSLKFHPLLTSSYMVELITNMMKASPGERWSCHDIYRRATTPPLPSNDIKVRSSAKGASGSSTGGSAAATTGGGNGNGGNGSNNAAPPPPSDNGGSGNDNDGSAPPPPPSDLTLLVKEEESKRRYNEWFSLTSTDPHWMFTEDMKTAIRQSDGHRTLLPLAGYRSKARFVLTFKSPSYSKVLFGIACATNLPWNTTNGAWLDCSEGYFYCRAGVFHLGTCASMTQVQFVLDIVNVPTIEIWYDGKKKCEWSFTQLELQEEIYVVVACRETGTIIEMDAPLDEEAPIASVVTTMPHRGSSFWTSENIALWQGGQEPTTPGPSRPALIPPPITEIKLPSPAVPTSVPPRGRSFPSHEWSNNIRDYVLMERLGPHPNPSGLVKFYGTSSAVYRARLTDDAKKRAFEAKASSSLSQGDFALKIVYNDDTSGNDAVPLQDAKTELDFYRRFSHNHVIPIEHYFVDYIPIDPPPPDWEGFGKEINLCMVMELWHLSLQDVIDYRRRPESATDTPEVPHGVRPLFKADEVLKVGHQISGALWALNEELVAHRDIKPANILIRLPPNVTRQQAYINLNLPNIIFALSDFGALCDFGAEGHSTMVRYFNVNEPRGGCCYAPEIHLTPRTLRVELDYTKSDIWSLGEVFVQMLATPQFLIDNKENVVDNWRVMLPRVLDAARARSGASFDLCEEVINNVVTPNVYPRWSAARVFNTLEKALRLPSSFHQPPSPNP